MQDLRAPGRSRKAWFITAVAIVFVASLVVEAKSADRLSELIQLTGLGETLDDAFDQVGPGVKAAMTQTLPNSPILSPVLQEKVLAGMEPAADTAFAPERLQREFRLAMTGKLNSADIESIFAFERSPLGSRMIALEKASQGAGAQSRIAKMGGELLERLKNEPERAEILARMDSSLRFTEIATDIALNTSRAVATGMAAGAAATDEKAAVLPDEAIRAIYFDFEKMRPATAAQVKEETLLLLAYTYREASIPELRQYLVFLTSQAGKRFYGAVMSAMNEVLLKAGREFGHALMRELGKERA
jgi:hypothetical protein